MPTNGFFNGCALVLRFLFLHSHECLLTLQIMCFFFMLSHDGGEGIVEEA